MTQAESDQEHLPLCLCHAPQIPDRTAYILGRSQESPLPGIVRAGLTLKAMGADLLAIPCVTASYFHDEIERQTGLRTVHAVRATADLLSAKGVCRAAVLATQGTVMAGLFQDQLQSRGIEAILPDGPDQAAIGEIIFDRIKRGIPPDTERFLQICRRLTDRGAQRLILGCTELSLIAKDRDLGEEFLDVLDVLAASAITACGRPVRETARHLLLPSEERV